MHRTRRVRELLGIELPILQAPMAGAQDVELAVAVALAGGLGALPCAMLSADAIGAQVAAFRARCDRPLNLNFFCHHAPASDPAIDARWRDLLSGYYRELGLDPSAPSAGAARAPFDSALCDVVEALRPAVVSFHFGLPAAPLLDRVRATGAKVLSSATTVAEARELERAGSDAIIAQGAEAGGHRGMFLTTDVGAQLGTFALVPQMVDAVRVPVIAAGGIGDGRGVVAAIALGASAVQIGTAYLRCPESRISAPFRAALARSSGDDTRITNVVTGRPARGIANRVVRELGPMRDDVPAFPRAASALAALRASAEANGSSDFSPLWAGQALHLAREVGALELTREIGRDALAALADVALE